MAKEHELWTTTEALRHLRLRLEAALLNRALHYGMKALMLAKARLNELAERERVLNGETIIKVVKRRPSSSAAQ